MQEILRAVSVDTIPNRTSPPTVLLREAWREGTRIRRRTLANLSKAPPELVAGIRALVKGGVIVSGIDQVLNIRRSLPHGHVAAVLGMARELGLEKVRGNEMLGMPGWLRERQPWIERSLANRRLVEGSLLLHDVTSSFATARPVRWRWRCSPGTRRIPPPSPPRWRRFGRVSGSPGLRSSAIAA